MNKQDFFEELQELLELDFTLTETTVIGEIDSLNLLSLITFLDENFDIQKTGEELKSITSVKNIIDLIGEDSLS
ncbi:hypothetical protein AWE51_22370 [Aquimarina aggregata]|uniref:Carrier domain-containing protein n=1 Tax=Aquimarina aggregata TaxID=1642818 RepID=A0A163BJ31_9FLAO|nr:acyl carrier protein [Aquimarina aggregata]KZS41451.1 hypothetical protein AWE51_22370 [Aquimarina aggregata]